MSQQDKKEYILSYESIELSGWDPKMNSRPMRIAVMKYFPSLKKAFDELKLLDAKAFNEALCLKELRPRVYTKAFIMEDDKMLLMNRYIEDYKHSNLRDGLYIELNNKLISKESFEKETGHELGNLVLKGPLLDYYLVPNTSIGQSIPLDGQQRELQRRIHYGSKKLRDDKEGGLKI
ncbi:hypothetical protein [Niastella sp. OAS944]|uniref:hypothetical protein n=1 Tax=Niastella sp. OAS944 TaxID=2664089 RepID=UPI003489F640|nr:hypothetical protein [Chitinophagaceae bacterium OAS944]